MNTNSLVGIAIGLGMLALTVFVVKKAWDAA